MIGLKGPSLLPEEKDWILREGAAGVILFRRNILSLRQLSALCLSLKALAQKRAFPPYFFIGTDLEGGSVDRLKHLAESRPWPSAKEMSRLPPDRIFQIARRKGALLKSLGIDINFAPVADFRGKSAVLKKGRAFGDTKEAAVSAALPYVRGLLEGGVQPCLKHFPGHGGAAEDSHLSLPQDERSREALRLQMQAFREILEAAPVPFVMTAHVEFPKIESGPASFSPKILRGELRGRIGFQGGIVSDDMDMGALAGFSPPERVSRALRAGCHLILCCQKPETWRRAADFFLKNPDQALKIQPFIKEAFLKLQAISRLRPGAAGAEAAPAAEPRRRNPGGGTPAAEPRRRNPGGGTPAAEPRRARDRGRRARGAFSEDLLILFKNSRRRRKLRK